MIEEIVPGSAPEIEEQALRTRDGAEALRLYGLLQSRFPGTPEGVRAAIWVGLYYYGAGEDEAALGYFERARKYARDPELLGRSDFWCDQVRLRTGREPLSIDEVPAAGRYRALQVLAHVDRSVREGRRSEAETYLLSIEGEARRAGLLGPYVARWGDLFRMPGTGRVNRSVLAPLIFACSGLPERLRISAPADPVPQAAPELWAIQFGAFLDAGNAARQVEELRRRGLDVRVDETEEDGRTLVPHEVGRVRHPGCGREQCGAAHASGGDCRRKSSV